MYSKLFAKIVDSSIWLEPDHVRIVWLTFLAMKDQKGFVWISTPANVAIRARVSVEQAEDAIKRLESPDPYGRTQEYDGRRIERVGDGWLVLNAKKYDDIVYQEHMRERNRIRQAAFREKNRDEPSNNERRTKERIASNAVSTVDRRRDNTESESESEKEEKYKKEESAPSARSRLRSVTVSLEELIAEGCDEQAAKDWITSRGKSKLTRTAWTLLKNEATKAGVTPAEAVRIAAGNSWRGFKAEWLKSDRKSGDDWMSQIKD
jgi:hypothetical protein